MIGTLSSFIAELRSVGLPVSTAEAIDAANALAHVDVGSETAMREALAATLIKAPRHRRAFDIAFDVFFAIGVEPATAVQPSDPGEPAAGVDRTGLMESLAAALLGGDGAALRQGVRRAVDQLAGFQTGRPVGGRYYLYRVLQRLEGIEDLLVRPDGDDPLAKRLAREDVAALMDTLRDELRREIVRRLVADRGPEPVARTLREPLVDDIDLMHATRDELARIESAIAPLARKLATRLDQRRRHSSRGRLDVRRTIRASLPHGGALIDPRFRHPRRSKPEIVLLCDVSGSMATFARFALQFTYAVGNQFSRVRSYAFIDAVDEITGLLEPGAGMAHGLARLSAEARLVAHDGHSDYGAVLRGFWMNHREAITPQTTVIVTGDARNNYRDVADELFAAIADRARATFWLNPEAKRFWDTGDSVMSRYASSCTDVFEVRTLRQLERFVERVALHRYPSPATT